MMKVNRLAKIKELIDKFQIETQEELTLALRDHGIEVTQATVSRDIKELGLVKVHDSNGHYHYAYPKVHNDMLSPERLERTISECVVSVRASECLVVVRTLPGTAQAVGYAVDSLNWPEVLGTIGGDDTIFIAPTGREAVAELLKRFRN